MRINSRGTASFTTIAAMLFLSALVAACGGKQSVASKSAAAFREAQQKGLPISGDAHGGHSASGAEDSASTTGGTDHSTMTGMDQSAMTGMDHSNMPGMKSRGQSGMAGMDHSSMPGMKSGAQPGMAGMDHSNMPAMKSGAQPGMAGMDHSNMPGMKSGAQSGMAGMDHSNIPGMKSGAQPGMVGMDQSNMPGMKGGTLPGMAGMDHSKMQQGGMAGMQQGSTGTAANLIVSAPRSNAEIARLAPKATLTPDEFDAPAPIAVSEAAKASGGGMSHSAPNQESTSTPQPVTGHGEHAQPASPPPSKPQASSGRSCIGAFCRLYLPHASRGHERQSWQVSEMRHDPRDEERLRKDVR